MFISSFPYQKINHITKVVGEDKLIEYVYSFRGKTGKRYLIIVEEYTYFIFIVKFCLQERKYHPDRFNVLTNLNECSRVITTIGKLITELYQKNPFASFGFIGSNLPEEEKSNTKRYRLYSLVVSQLISPVKFEHRRSNKHSAYLLINKDNQEPNLLSKIEEMFERIYDL